MIVSELQFFEIERKLHGIDAMIFHQPFFCKCPETFDTIDVHFTISEPFRVVDAFLFEPVLNEPVITSESVGIDQAASPDLPDSQFQ